MSISKDNPFLRAYLFETATKEHAGGYTLFQTLENFDGYDSDTVFELKQYPNLPVQEAKNMIFYYLSLISKDIKDINLTLEDRLTIGNTINRLTADNNLTKQDWRQLVSVYINQFLD